MVCTVQRELEMYTAFHKLNEKYGKTFLDWYHEHTEHCTGDFPTILSPKNEMESDIMKANEKIEHPREFTFEEICLFEEKVCKFLAHNISCSRVIHNEKDKMILFRDRYSWFRHYYMIKLDI
jgi:hypothetical protein